MNPSLIEVLAAVLFGIAVLHTFSTSVFQHLAYKYPKHAGLWHMLGEVEAVFGIWALVLVVAIAVLARDSLSPITYLEGKNYTEPLFVFAIMAIAASKPILDLAFALVHYATLVLSGMTKLSRQVVSYFITLSLVPLLGSLITEPAAMTLAALLLRDKVFNQTENVSLKYWTMGVLFVNVSVGGALTNFAAPPILMVAAAWGWNITDVFGMFGTKALGIVFINALWVSFLVHRQLPPAEFKKSSENTPWFVQLIHLTFLGLTVVFAHHPVVFLAMFLFFLGYTQAYSRYQTPLLLKESLMVAFFLAGLVVLGGLQQWWLQPLLESMSATVVYFGATALTAITDNAALTYLGSLVSGTTDEFKYALVAGAITGGGLTVIANAPNPAGLAILRDYFPEQTVSPVRLLIAALPATFVAVCVFQLF